MKPLPDTIQQAITALHKYRYNDAAACLLIQLILYRRGRCTASELRQTANQFLQILAS